MLKKVLATAIAAAMIFGLASVALAGFTDTAGNPNEKAIARLTSLGILIGYPDGTFKPEGNITRAEFAAAVVRALGLEDSAKALVEQPSFSDCANATWAWGYINVAAAQGIITGYPDGTFRPNNNVTYAEALAMILRALGYEPTLKGTWPAKYLVKAAELGITKGVTFSANAPATRGNVAALLDNSLTVEKIVQTGWGDQIKYEKSGKTLLDENVGLTKVEGRVVDIALTSSDLKETQVKVEWTENNQTKSGKYTLPAGSDTLALLGLEVKLWANKDNNVAYWDIKTPVDSVIYDSVYKVYTDSNNAITGLNLLRKGKDYNVASGYTVVKNFATSGVVPAVGNYGRFVLDADGKIAFAVLFDFESSSKVVNSGLVTEASSSKIKYRDPADVREIRFSDYANGVKVFDSKLNTVTVDKIQPDSVIYAWTSPDSKTLYVIVAGSTVKGELSAVTSSRATIGGTNYYRPSYDFSTLTGKLTYSEDNDATVAQVYNSSTNSGEYLYIALENLLGTGVTGVLDINGRIRHIRGTVSVLSGVQFGVALDGTPATFDQPAKVKVLTKSGTIEVYTFEEPTDYATVLQPILNPTSGSATNVVIAFKLNAQGQIAKNQIAYVPSSGSSLTGGTGWPSWLSDYTVYRWTGATPDKTDDYLTDGTNRAYVVGATSLFSQINPGTKTTAVKDEDIKALSWADIEAKDLTNADLVVVAKNTGLDAVCVYFKDGYGVVAEKFYGVVTASPWLTASGWRVKINTFGQGVKEYAVTKDVRSALSYGYVVTVTTDASGTINRVEWAPNTTFQSLSGSYIQLAVGGGKWYRVADNAVLYEYRYSDGTLYAISLSDLRSGDVLSYVLDENGKVVALVRVVPSAGASNKPLPNPEVKISLAADANNDGYVNIDEWNKSKNSNNKIVVSGSAPAGWTTTATLDSNALALTVSPTGSFSGEVAGESPAPHTVSVMSAYPEATWGVSPLSKTLAFTIDLTPPGAAATNPVTWAASNKLKIAFSEAVDVSKVTLAKIVLPTGESFGDGAQIAAVNPTGGYATEFEITLGTNATIAGGETLTIAKTNVVDKAGNPAAADVVFTVPQP